MVDSSAKYIGALDLIQTYKNHIRVMSCVSNSGNKDRKVKELVDDFHLAFVTMVQES